MFHNIVQVVPTDNYDVYVYFDDGKTVCFDAKPMLDKPVFNVLKDKRLFIDSCTILNDTLAWDVSGQRDPYSCIDIDPETLYSLDHVSEIPA